MLDGDIKGEGRSEGEESLMQTPFSLFLPPEKNRSYVISSFTELKAYDLLSKASVQFVEYP